MHNKRTCFNEELFHKTLSNGLQLFFMPKKGFTKKYAVLATNYGSNDLTFRLPGSEDIVHLHEGIAHFLEHKMFEQPDGSDAFEAFAALGANANAFTNFNMTAYLFSASEQFHESLSHLLSYVYAPHFTDENVKKEQGIIAQEIKMYDDSANWRIFANALAAMYVNHPNRHDIAGTVDSIYQITKEELYQCYNAFYAPTNMALFIIGDLDFEEICALVEAAPIRRQEFVAGVERIMEPEPNYVARKTVVEEMEVSIPMFTLGIKDAWGQWKQGAELCKQSLETEMIMSCLFKKGSVLFEELYNEQLIFEPFSCEYNAHQDYGYSLISAETRDVEAVHARILQSIADAKEQGIDPTRFEMVKKSRIGGFVRAFDSIENIANTFLMHYFEGIHFFDIYDILKSITLEDLNRRLKEHFVEDQMVLSIIQPIQGEQ